MDTFVADQGEARKCKHNQTTAPVRQSRCRDCCRIGRNWRRCAAFRSATGVKAFELAKNRCTVGRHAERCDELKNNSGRGGHDDDQWGPFPMFRMHHTIESPHYFRLCVNFSPFCPFSLTFAF